MQQIKPENKTPPAFAGIYDNWHSVPNIGKGLKGERWFKRIQEQLLNYRNEVNTNSNTSPPRPSDLALICGVYNFKSIVDFGGSSGWLWDYIKLSNKKNNISKYTIIETKEVCDYAKKYNFHDYPVEYITCDEYIGSSEIFYCNSVLQYFDEESFFITFIKKTNAKLILLEDIYVGDFDDFYTAQIYYEDRIPVKFRNKEKFIKLFEHNGFSTITIKPYICAHRELVQPLPMDGFPEDKKIKYASTIFLKKH